MCLFFYRFYVNKKISKISNKTTAESIVEIDSILNKVSKHVILPEGKPSIFVVQDPDLLIKQQAFFKGVEKGDSLIVYPEIGKAIIYSNSRDIIVNVGPVTFDQDDKGAENVSTKKGE